MSSCYVIVFYFGDRRRKFSVYEEDRLCYVKKNIEYLTKVKNSLDKIYFVFNVEPDHYDLLNQAIELVPKKIQGAEIEVVVRQNIGISYGAWSDIMDSKDHDYYIFGEDDYYWVEDGWDRYMIKNFQEKENCGGFGAAIRPGRKWNNYKEHFGCCLFCISKEVIKNVKENYNGFNFRPSNDYKTSELNQYDIAGGDLIRAGYNIYDVRDDYRIYYALTADSEKHRIQELFTWNEKTLVIPDTIAWGMNYVYWRSFDEEFQKDFRKTYPHPNPLKTPNTINILTRCSKIGEKFKRTLSSVKDQQTNLNWFISYENQEVYEYLTNQDLPPNTTLVKVPQYSIIPNLGITYEHHDAHTDYANWDWEKWQVTPYMGEIPETKTIELSSIRYRKGRFWCETLKDSTKRHAPHFPYNLYLKILEAQVQEGWIIHLDDGDVFETNDSLKKLQEEITKHDENTLHIFKLMNRGRGWTTPIHRYWEYYDASHPMIHGECSGSCLCYHVKWKNYTVWDEWRFADYRTARALETVIPKRNLFNEVIIYTP